jgi:hypothetical protein
LTQKFNWSWATIDFLMASPARSWCRCLQYDTTGLRLGYTHLPFGGTGAWLPVTFTYVAPASAVRVSIAAQSTLAGTFWFDDIGLTAGP